MICSEGDYWLIAIPAVSLKFDESNFVTEHFSEIMIYGTDNNSHDNRYIEWGSFGYDFGCLVTRIKMPKKLAVEFCMRFSS